jgi:hypothetical protein
MLTSILCSRHEGIWGRRVKAPGIRNFWTRLISVIRLTHQSLYHFQGKRPKNIIIWWLGRPQNQSGRFGEGINLLSLSRIERTSLERPARSLVTVLSYTGFLLSLRVNYTKRHVLVLNTNFKPRSLSEYTCVQNTCACNIFILFVVVNINKFFYCL